MQPLDTRVLVKIKPIEEKTASGIILPSEVKDRQKYDMNESEILAMGAGAFADWLETKEDKPKVGDIVITAKYAGLPIDEKDEMKRLIQDYEILAIKERRK